MTHQTLTDIAKLIDNSKDPINVKLDNDRLILTTDKNDLSLAFSIILILFAGITLWFYDRSKYNFEIGLVAALISIQQFWLHQSINKTIIVDRSTETIKIVPKYFILKWTLENILKVKLSLPFSNIPNLKLTSYMPSKYQYTQRIYFKQKLLSVYLLEFKNKATAQEVLRLLSV